MSTEYDPKLQALFRQAASEFDHQEFTRRVMMVLWSMIGIVALVAVALIAVPLTSAVAFASQFLPASLVEIESDWLQKLLSPINSVAAAIAIGALLLRKFYRRIFR